MCNYRWAFGGSKNSNSYVIESPILAIASLQDIYLNSTAIMTTVPTTMFSPSSSTPTISSPYKKKRLNRNFVKMWRQAEKVLITLLYNFPFQLRRLIVRSACESVFWAGLFPFNSGQQDQGCWASWSHLELRFAEFEREIRSR